MVLSLDKLNRIITVPAPTTEINCQTLINEIRDWEDEIANMEVAKVADASGKDNLGGGLQVGITLRLLNWKLKFEDRLGPDYVDCVVKGGNLVAVDEYNQPMNPIEPAAYVTVTLTQAVSAALLAEWTQIEKDGVISKVDAIKPKTDLLPADPASQSSVESHVTVEVDDLITRNKGLDDIHDDQVTHDVDIKGTSWTDEASLKKIKEAIGRLPSTIHEVIEEQNQI